MEQKCVKVPTEKLDLQQPVAKTMWVDESWEKADEIDIKQCFIDFNQAVVEP